MHRRSPYGERFPSSSFSSLPVRPENEEDPLERRENNSPFDLLYFNFGKKENDSTRAGGSGAYCWLEEDDDTTRPYIIALACFDQTVERETGVELSSRRVYRRRARWNGPRLIAVCDPRLALEQRCNQSFGIEADLLASGRVSGPVPFHWTGQFVRRNGPNPTADVNLVYGAVARADDRFDVCLRLAATVSLTHRYTPRSNVSSSNELLLDLQLTVLRLLRGPHTPANLSVWNGIYLMARKNGGENGRFEIVSTTLGNVLVSSRFK